MRSTDRDRKESRYASEGKGSDVQADRYIDQVLRHDRVLLAGKHDRERSRTRAMGLLAASAMPAAEGGLVSSIAKFLGTKGIAGTLGVIVVAGGVTLSALFVTRPSGKESSASQTKAGQTGVVSATQPEMRTVPGSVIASERDEPATTIPDPLRGIGTQNGRKASEPHDRFEETSRIETQEALSPDGLGPVVIEDRGPLEPEVHHRNSVHTTMKVDPVIVQKK